MKKSRRIPRKRSAHAEEQGKGGGGSTGIGTTSESDEWCELYGLAVQISLKERRSPDAETSIAVTAVMRQLLSIIKERVHRGDPAALELVVWAGSAFAEMFEMAASEHLKEVRAICERLPSVPVLVSPKAFRKESAKADTHERKRLRQLLQDVHVGTRSVAPTASHLNFPQGEFEEYATDRLLEVCGIRDPSAWLWSSRVRKLVKEVDDLFPDDSMKIRKDAISLGPLDSDSLRQWWRNFVLPMIKRRWRRIPEERERLIKNAPADFQEPGVKGGDRAGNYVIRKIRTRFSAVAKAWSAC